MNGGKMSNKYEFIAPCHFGLEAVCKREIADLGYEIVKVEDGKVTFAGDMDVPECEKGSVGRVFPIRCEILGDKGNFCKE